MATNPNSDGANSFDDFDSSATDDPEEDSLEARVWQLLLLINPGDEETALQQFTDYREAVADVKLTRSSRSTTVG